MSNKLLSSYLNSLNGLDIAQPKPMGYKKRDKPSIAGSIMIGVCGFLIIAKLLGWV